MRRQAFSNCEFLDTAGDQYGFKECFRDFSVCLYREALA